jgi:hypothetical protein
VAIFSVCGGYASSLAHRLWCCARLCRETVGVGVPTAVDCPAASPRRCHSCSSTSTASSGSTTTVAIRWRTSSCAGLPTPFACAFAERPGRPHRRRGVRDPTAWERRGGCGDVRRESSPRHPARRRRRGRPWPTTASFGIAAAQGMSIGTLVGAADRALYRAKAEDRNRVCTAEAGDAGSPGPTPHPDGDDHRFGWCEWCSSADD